ncbi:DNA-binding protein [Synechococcus moorigangaii CMS01]|nr:DNA-binding protein [Synechococcus moorigangaii CMS01]
MINTQIKPIRTEADYEKTLLRIEELMNAEPNTPEFDELEVLATLVENYEEKEYPIDAPNPIAAIRFRMDQQGLKQSDLVPYIGSKSKVSEVLSGKRELSKKMIIALHGGLNIPLESLLQSSVVTHQ